MKSELLIIIFVFERKIILIKKMKILSAKLMLKSCVMMFFYLSEVKLFFITFVQVV